MGERSGARDACGGSAVARVAGLILVTGLAACSQSSTPRPVARVDQRAPAVQRASAVQPETGVSSSPRVFAERDPIPKGGGTYKLGIPYKVADRWYFPAEDHAYDRSGQASWYGRDFHGRKTANGEIYDMNALTAAHTTLPLPSYAYVTNLDNGRTILVRINDRGPYVHNRMIDLSRTAARALGSEGAGLARVRVRYAGRAPLDGNDYYERQFLARQPWSMMAGRAGGGGRMGLTR